MKTKPKLTNRRTPLSRDQLAAMAMQGIATRGIGRGPDCDLRDDGAKTIAREAYMIADAMLELSGGPIKNRSNHPSRS
jgi:hypothetical protein